MDRVFLSGSKAEVLLSNLSRKVECTDDLLLISQPETTEKVMRILDAINGRWGMGPIRLASVPNNSDWRMRRVMMILSFTLAELFKIMTLA